jgi:L-threonylcarbamoyladenylate synthase
MTLILKRSKLARDYITGGQENVGLRVPSQPVALSLLSEFELLGGLGIAAPSANRFGAVSPTTSESVEQELGSFLQIEDLILDGGQSEVGVESTIIDCKKNNPVVLRPGAITNVMIENTTGFKVQFNQNEIRASGLLESHYSPKAKVVIDETAEPGDGFIALANIPTPTGVIRLASPENIEEYARDLYGALRAGDQKGLKKIKIIQPKGDGLALAIRDRSGKAASGKGSF